MKKILSIVKHSGLRFLLSAPLLFSALFLLIAIFSYDATDPSVLHELSTPWHKNMAGYYGAFFADPIMQAVGYAFLFPIFFLLATGLKIFRHQENSLIILRLLSLLLLIATASTALSFLQNIEETNLIQGYSGYLGIFLQDELLSLGYIKPNMLLAATLMIIATTSLFSCNITIREFLFIAKSIVKYFIIAVLYFAAVLQFLYLKLKLLAHKFGREENIESISSSVAKEQQPVENPLKIVSKKVQKAKVLNTQPKLVLDEGSFNLPSTNLLSALPVSSSTKVNHSLLEQNSKILKNVLSDFGVECDILRICPGPVVTLYEIEPSAGTKSSKVVGLADDIARSMSAVSARIAVIPGKNAIGIELPNARREVVYLKEILECDGYSSASAKLPLILGKNIAGESVVADLAKMPHLLVAGTTGSGKSVAINTMILSLLFKHSPQQCKFLMIDPKMLELSVYEGIPHLITPVVTEPRKAVTALKWVVREMENRYRSMSTLGVRNIYGYNEAIEKAKRNGIVLTKKIQVGFDTSSGDPIYETVELDKEPLPYIVVIVDEMADLMLVAGKDIEGSIQRLAQMARAAGIHLIMATQRPSVDVITGVIKANFPTRISFQVTSKIDSRTILGEQGAEQLLGMGDMLYMSGGGKIERVHGPFVADEEVESIVSYLKKQGRPNYIEDVTATEDEDGNGPVADYGAFSSSNFNSSDFGSNGLSGSGDELYQQAIKVVIKSKRPSISYVQRYLKIGYNRAANLLEQMEKDGIVSEPNHQGKREIILENRQDGSHSSSHEDMDD